MSRKPRKNLNRWASSRAPATNPDAMKTKNQLNGQASSGASTTDPVANKFTTPTPGLEKVKFTWGSARDGAKFTDTSEKLAWYVGTQTRS